MEITHPCPSEEGIWCSDGCDGGVEVVSALEVGSVVDADDTSFAKTVHRTCPILKSPNHSTTQLKSSLPRERGSDGWDGGVEVVSALEAGSFVDAEDTSFAKTLHRTYPILKPDKHTTQKFPPSGGWHAVPGGVPTPPIYHPTPKFTTHHP